MNRALKTICAIGSTLLLLASFLLIFIFAWIDGYSSTIACVCGLGVSFVLAPILHEFGHVIFAIKADMQPMYVKMFCLRYTFKNGKKHWSVVSPLEDDETQVLPKSSGNMQQRAMQYTLGGLIFGGIFLIAFLLLAIVLMVVGRTSYFVLGIVPYMGYLELLNLLPIEYGSGKTDMLICIGLKHGDDTEKVMLSAMEIQGKLYEGYSFSQIEENLYFHLPQLCEDEPLFAVILDLRYRYYLEKGNVENAADCLNRLVNAQAYIPKLEMTKIATELVYMHSITGNVDLAQESSKYCEEYLCGETVDAKRALAAFSAANGNMEAVEILIKQAESIVETEWIEGVKKSEKLLLSRILAM